MPSRRHNVISHGFPNYLLPGKGGERDRTSGLVVLLAGGMLLASPLSGEDNMPRIGRNVIIAGATALVLAAGSSIATAAVMSSPSPVDSSGTFTAAGPMGS